MWKIWRKVQDMMSETVVSIVSIAVTIISIIVTVISILHDTTHDTAKHRHQKSNRPAKE